jgi:hypothetical protein
MGGEIVVCVEGWGRREEDGRVEKKERIEERRQTNK